MTSTPLDRALEVHIDLSTCIGKRDLLDRFAAALRFPSWFGHNWDAMHDCLTDLSWLPASAYRVVLSHPALLREHEPETLASALQVLADATVFWASEGIAFTVNIIDEGAEPGADVETSS